MQNEFDATLNSDYTVQLEHYQKYSMSSSLFFRAINALREFFRHQESTLQFDGIINLTTEEIEESTKNFTRGLIVS